MIRFEPIAVIVKVKGLEVAIGLPFEWVCPKLWKWLEESTEEL
jgi:hypothetical protein